MAAKKWTLIDAATNTHAGELAIRPEDARGAARGWSVTQRTLRAGLSKGVTVVHVDNGTLALDILPTRGMGVWNAWLADEQIGWHSPVRGPVHPSFVDLGEPSGLGWLDGFDELLVRCGLESNGAPEFDQQGRLAYPLHGRIANRPAHKVEVEIDDAVGQITVRGEVEETRFLFFSLRMTTTLSTRVGQPGFSIRDTITNLSQRPAEMQLLYHVNFGPPRLDAGARLIAPVKTVVPRDQRAAEGISNWDSYAAQQPGFQEQVYFFELLADRQDDTRVMLKNAHGTRGVSMSFNKRQLPCFTLWKNTAAAADGYVTGLEPGTNFPNPRSYEGEQGRVVKLEPAGQVTFDLAFEFHHEEDKVAAAEKQIAALQGDTTPEIHETPQQGWCP